MRRVLIANRGEIAVRVAHACHADGLETVAVYSEADRDALHVRTCHRSVCIGAASAVESYLNVEKILQAAEDSGADAIHPGYGFLSENAGFAAAVADRGLIWIGPSPEAIRTMGDKITARSLMEAAGVPVVPGFVIDDAFDVAKAPLPFPWLVKASAGGGGKGMRRVDNAGELESALAGARREALAAFSNDAVYVEKFLEGPRHVEIQIFGDSHGDVVSLGERECSIQRRHQKIVEEAPAPSVDQALRDRMGAAAVAAGKAVGYEGAGTVEFLLEDDGEFYFLEMNTRIQVEHPITECVMGVDLVQAQLAVARGEALPWKQDELVPRGHAIEVRLYAEDPSNGFLPQTGRLLRYNVPEGPGIRHDGGVRAGDDISVHYDPMLAKLIAFGATREEAIDRLVEGLGRWAVHGVTTNLHFLKEILLHPEFRAGRTHIAFLAEHFPNEAICRPEVGDDVFVALALAQHATSQRSRNGSSAHVGDWVSPWRSIGPWRTGS
jgi:acetyl-CoA carboxylase biotin carboxylase subunit